MKVEYLRELLTARCEGVLEAIDEIRHTNAVLSSDEGAVLDYLANAAERAAFRFREVRTEKHLRPATEAEVYDGSAKWCKVCEVSSCHLAHQDSLVICERFSDGLSTKFNKKHTPFSQNE